MIAAIIRWSLHNRFLVLLASLFLFGWGLYAVKKTPIDAIPDLSDVQVIIKSKYPGRPPKLVQEQVTYPLTTTLLAVPKAKAVRGFSFFGESFVYVLFEEGTDLYWARSRILEYLNQAKLPEGVRPEIGPDATGVGWIYQYALIDPTGKHDISELRALQDWFLKFELRSVPGVSEIATVGGMVKEYQIIIDPIKLRSLQLPLSHVLMAINNSSRASGGSAIELAEADYMLRANGLFTSLYDIGQTPIVFSPTGTPVLLKDIGRIRLGPESRRGIAELNGQGEVVGGIVVMRSGQNALDVIQGIKEKLDRLKPSLPPGVEVVSTYDRSNLIQRAVNNLNNKLLEESFIVALVCLLFLAHFRSSLVVILALPLGIFSAFTVMYYQGLNANIMSLGGIALAIGTMVDAAIVMIENVHKHLETWMNEHTSMTLQNRLQILIDACIEVGPALFFSLLIITISFMPIFTLQAQEGLLFTPLALTKTYAMAAAAGLSITLVPVLMFYFIQGRLPKEQQNPFNRYLSQFYKHFLSKILNFPFKTLGIALVLTLLTFFPIHRLGSEFMPPLQEGDLLYMPSAFPSLSIGKATQILQQTDKMIATLPEVKSVMGKAGRAETATDPAPIEMLETIVQLKDSSQWRPGMTLDKITDELNQRVKLPGLVNLWVQPIRNRIDMLSTGLKSPVGIKISGPDIAVIDVLGQQIETLLKSVKGTRSVYAERLNLGRYIDISIDRIKAARYGFSIADIADVINTAIGGEAINEVITSTQRYPVNIRYPQHWRDSPEKLRHLPLISPTKTVVTLGHVADIKVIENPFMYKSENARLSGWVYIDVEGRDLGSYVKEAQEFLSTQLQLPSEYTLSWSGQYEYMQRATQRMMLIVPLTLAAIFLLLYVVFRNVIEPFFIMISLPFSVIGGFWFVYMLGYNMSLAVAVGFIALAGVAAEFGVVMLLYLKQAINHYHKEKKLRTLSDLKEAILEGAALRVRPKSMTVMAILAGLLPIMFGQETGSDVMQRIAAPMIGGMVTAPLLSMVVMPVIYFLWQKKTLKL